jgi:hypothetical protein
MVYIYSKSTATHETRASRNKGAGASDEALISEEPTLIS